MQMRAKKIITVLFCAMLMVASVLSVSAAEARHVCVWEDEITSVGAPYRFQNEDYHYATAKVLTLCKGCDAKNGYREDKEFKQSHSWGYAEDAGHQGKYDHKYRLTCSYCGGSKTVTILCDFLETGSHRTP